MNKIYLVDVGQRNALVGKMGKELFEESEVGLVIQNIVFNHAKRIKFILTKYAEHEIYYWEDNQKTEVDIVFDKPFIIPIEVKSKSGEKGIKSVSKFLSQNKKAPFGIIITLSDLKIKDKILFLPLWAFLLLC